MPVRLSVAASSGNTCGLWLEAMVLSTSIVGWGRKKYQGGSEDPGSEKVVLRN